MPDPHDEDRGLPEREEGDGTNESSEPVPAEEGDELQGEERRAKKARRVVTFAQVVVAVCQAVDAVIRLFA